MVFAAPRSGRVDWDPTFNLLVDHVAVRLTGNQSGVTMDMGCEAAEHLDPTSTPPFYTQVGCTYIGIEVPPPPAGPFTPGEAITMIGSVDSTGAAAHGVGQWTVRILESG